MRTLLFVLTLGVAMLTVPAFAIADEPTPTAVAANSDGYVPPVCGDPDVDTLSAADCTGVEPVPSLDPADIANPPTVAELEAKAAAFAATEPSPADLPQYCRAHVNVYFYAPNDWLRLGQKLQANASACADYYIDIPPLATDKTNFRCAQDDLIRALGPRFHPVAELHFGGWNAWWNAVPGRTPAQAGQEFLRRVKACGYDFANGETWALNEMHSGIRANNQGARDKMREFLNALAAGLPGVEPPTQGIVWVIGVGQNTSNFSIYKPQLEGWFQDAPFWQDMAHDVAVWGQEAFPNMPNWGVADASRNERTRNLTFFLEHPLLLVEQGPSTADAARDFFEETYVPLANAAWQFASGFGNTMFSDDQMKRFISEETFATKFFSQSRPHSAPNARVAMVWSPNRIDIEPKLFTQLTAGILDRLASAIGEAYEYGDGSLAGACGPPGGHAWCSADIPDAAFNPLWEPTFGSW